MYKFSKFVHKIRHVVIYGRHIIITGHWHNTQRRRDLWTKFTSPDAVDSAGLVINTTSAATHRSDWSVPKNPQQIEVCAYSRRVVEICSHRFHVYMLCFLLFSFFFSLFVLFTTIVTQLWAASIDGLWPTWQPAIIYTFYIIYSIFLRQIKIVVVVFGDIVASVDEA